MFAVASMLAIVVATDADADVAVVFVFVVVVATVSFVVGSCIAVIVGCFSNAAGVILVAWALANDTCPPLPPPPLRWRCSVALILNGSVCCVEYYLCRCWLLGAHFCMKLFLCIIFYLVFVLVFFYDFSSCCCSSGT